MNTQKDNESALARAIVYCRVASGTADSIDHALDEQARRCRAYALANGYEVVERFSDHASGTQADRTGMTAMMDYLRENKRKGGSDLAVLIDDISRLARSVEAHLRLRTEIADAGGVLISPRFEFSDEPESQLAEYMLASVTEYRNRQRRQP